MINLMFLFQLLDDTTRVAICFVTTPNQHELLTEFLRDGLWFRITFCPEVERLIRPLLRIFSESTTNAFTSYHAVCLILSSLAMLFCTHL
jgi:hypothetical protein